MFSFVRKLQEKKERERRLARLPQVARQHNLFLLQLYEQLKNGRFFECLEMGERWLKTIPVLRYTAAHHAKMLAMPEHELLKYCSTNFRPNAPNWGISAGERSRIYRRLHYGPAKYFNGCGVANLIFAVCCSRLGHISDSLKWKSLAISGGHLFKWPPSNFGPAELWRIIELSTIRDLESLGAHDEVIYLKLLISEEDLAVIYVPRDYVGSDPLGDMKRLMSGMGQIKVKVDFESESYIVGTVRKPRKTLSRSFGLTGLLEIIADQINCIVENPTIVDEFFEINFLEPDNPF